MNDGEQKPKPDRASCVHCGHEYARRNLKAAPNGGAICKDWFKCQQRRDAKIEVVRTGRNGSVRTLVPRRRSA